MRDAVFVYIRAELDKIERIAVVRIGRSADAERQLARAEVEAVLADGQCDYMSTFADRFPVAGFLASKLRTTAPRRRCVSPPTPKSPTAMSRTGRG